MTEVGFQHMIDSKELPHQPTGVPHVSHAIPCMFTQHALPMHVHVRPQCQLSQPWPTID